MLNENQYSVIETYKILTSVVNKIKSITNEISKMVSYREVVQNQVLIAEEKLREVLKEKEDGKEVSENIETMERVIEANNQELKRYSQVSRARLFDLGLEMSDFTFFFSSNASQLCKLYNLESYEMVESMYNKMKESASYAESLFSTK